jgi:hypothetical protein
LTRFLLRAVASVAIVGGLALFDVGPRVRADLIVLAEPVANPGLVDDGRALDLDGGPLDLRPALWTMAGAADCTPAPAAVVVTNAAEDEGGVGLDGSQLGLPSVPWATEGERNHTQTAAAALAALVLHRVPESPSVQSETGPWPGMLLVTRWLAGQSGDRQQGPRTSSQRVLDWLDALFTKDQIQPPLQLALLAPRQARLPEDPEPTSIFHPPRNSSWV